MIFSNLHGKPPILTGVATLSFLLPLSTGRMAIDDTPKVIFTTAQI
jgi:hypothetical protein